MWRLHVALPSGQSTNIALSPSSAIADLRLQAQQATWWFAVWILKTVMLLSSVWGHKMRCFIFGMFVPFHYLFFCIILATCVHVICQKKPTSEQKNRLQKLQKSIKLHIFFWGGSELGSILNCFGWSFSDDATFRGLQARIFAAHHRWGAASRSYRVTGGRRKNKNLEMWWKKLVELRVFQCI